MLSESIDFVFEKLTLDNIYFWDGFAEYQFIKYSRPIMDIITKKEVDISVGSNSFKTSIDIFKYYNHIRKKNHFTDRKLARIPYDYDIWIVYAISKYDNFKSFMDVPAQPNPENHNMNSYINHILSGGGHNDNLLETYSNIEMSFSLFAKEGIPFTSHAGIFRNGDYFVDASKHRHINLSMLLHGFAAMLSTIFYNNIHYMITSPVDDMLNIFLKSMDKNDYWYALPSQKKTIMEECFQVEEIQILSDIDTFILKYATMEDNEVQSTVINIFMGLKKYLTFGLSEEEIKNLYLVKFKLLINAFINLKVNEMVFKMIINNIIQYLNDLKNAFIASFENNNFRFIDKHKKISLIETLLQNITTLEYGNPLNLNIFFHYLKDYIIQSTINEDMSGITTFLKKLPYLEEEKTKIPEPVNDTNQGDTNQEKWIIDGIQYDRPNWCKCHVDLNYDPLNMLVITKIQALVRLFQN